MMKPLQVNVMLLLGVMGCSIEAAPPPPPPKSLNINTTVITNEPEVMEDPEATGNDQSNEHGQSAVNFGPMKIEAGFSPDPKVITGNSGGQRKAARFSSSCSGWVRSASPDHKVELTTAFSSLRFLVDGGDADTSLVVQKPSGEFLCNDDADGKHPMITGPMSAGVYSIWIGSYEKGKTVDYRFGISQSSITTAAALRTTGAIVAQSGEASVFGAVRLSHSFPSDPHIARGSVHGGTASASKWDTSCTGMVSPKPHHIFTALSDFATLKLMVSAKQDVSLIVKTEKGDYWCNDDFEGSNPRLSRSFPKGEYQIWIGAADPTRRTAYKLGFSELSASRPSAL